ncbi:MAG: type II toxin-antitoxin system VapC family toxin [Verrucomicrobia bacterium]|nr:type II toxin-antitoxin system VapC family toxin [Verrucomicrobiota bacterium]
MSAVFADTFYFLAYLNRADANHKAAVAGAQAVQGPLVTTAWVLTEVADAFAASASRRRMAAFIASLEADSATRIVPANQELFHRGLALYDQRPDKEWSLTDCISFVVMKDEGMTEALTGDHHFEQAGFTARLR